jgi:hypothetical protein
MPINGIIVGTAQGLSTAAYTTTANLITGRNQVIGKGIIQVFARGSATGMNMSMSVGGVSLCDDQQIPFYGTTGVLDVSAHQIISQQVNGGWVEFKLRNTTVGALTTDYIITFTPTK